MKKLLMILALSLPLMAQEVEVKEVDGNTEVTIKKETVPQKVVRHLQDAEWRKFQSAHRRVHSKRGEQYSDKESKGDKRKGMAKKRAIRSAVRIIVVGGVAYYIGYHQGQHNKHPMKRKPYMGDRK